MLRNQIQQEIIKLLKSGEKEKAEVLRYLFSQIKDEEINAGRKELTDEQVIKLINNQVKKLKESLEAFQKGGREDLAKKTKFELEVLGTYLPQQMSKEEIEKEVEKIMSQNPNLNNLGALIGVCVKNLSGKADNAQIAQIVKEKFSK